MKIKKEVIRKEGILFSSFDTFMKIVQFFSLVEWLKYFVRRKRPINDKVKRDLNITTDVFIIAKWILLLTIWYLNLSNVILTGIVFYLLFYNFITYFFYHTWDSRLYKKDDKVDEKRVKRRLLTLLLSYVYSLCIFAYLIGVPFSGYFNFTVQSTFLAPLLASFQNSVFANSPLISEKGLYGNALFSLQQAFSFFYVSIIISRSLSE